MTDSKSPGDRLLEFVVFGPAGLAVTLVEEFPKLVEKGRHRVEGQVHTARLVGQFAVQMGRRQVEQSLGHLGAVAASYAPGRGGDSAAPDPFDGTPVDHDLAGDVHVGDDPGAEGSGHRPEARRRGPAPRPTDERGPVEPTWHPPVWTGGGVPNGSGSPSSLAIPGYDSLSASQVVQRLEGLSSSELEEVRAHEATHRQRRTILHRVEQLLAGADGAQP